MKTMRAMIVAAAAVAMLSFSPGVSAQDQPAKEPPAKRQKAAGQGERRGPAARQGEGRFQPGQNLQNVLGQLDLTEDQKAQIKPIFEKMRTSMQELRDEPQGPERAQKMRQIMTQTREELSTVLTEEQRAKLRELMQSGQAGGRPGQQAANPIDRFANAVQQLDLSADQKTKIKEIVDGVRGEYQSIQANSSGDRKAMMEQVRPLLQEMREKIAAILTPEQTQKLHDQMKDFRGAQGPGADARPRGKRAAEKPADQQ